MDGKTNIHLTRNEIHYSLDELLEEFLVRIDQKEMSHGSIRNIIKRLKLKLPESSIETHYGKGYKLCIR